MQFLKQLKITQVEERQNDAWFDLSIRQLRQGKVRFYNVKDFLTGNWLFKVCSDKDLGKVMVRALKCPSGRRFAQLEGNTMVFQKSQIPGLLYDIVSVNNADEKDKLSRKVATTVEEIPAIIRENFETKSYEEATGKRAPGKYWVTLSKEGDEKAMVTLFLLERAWTLSPITPEEKVKELETSETTSEKKQLVEINTGHTLICPICDSEFNLIHIDMEKGCRHRLRKRSSLQPQV